MTFTSEPAVRCPVCGGSATDVPVSISVGDGAVEQITIRRCEDSACDAYYPMTGSPVVPGVLGEDEIAGSYLTGRDRNALCDLGVGVGAEVHAGLCPCRGLRAKR